MGAALTYLEEPKKEKELHDGASTHSSRSHQRHGVCEMQGWRVNMEDAALAVPDLDEQVSLFGVFDGHGGRGVSRFVARELPGIIKDTEGWQGKDYQKALEQAFVKVDDLLRADSGRKAVEELDKPDPDKPKRLLQVPKRMVERFKQNQARAAGEGEEGECDIDFDDDYGLGGFELEGEEEEGVEFEGDQEVDAESPDAAAVAQPTADAPMSDAGAPAQPAVQAPTSDATEVAAAEPPTADAPASNAEAEVQPALDPPASEAEVDAEILGLPVDANDEETADDDGDEDDDDDVLIDPGDMIRNSTPEAQGCTAVVVLVVHGGADGPQLICANAGDSRAMVSRLGDSVALSEDHKPENPGETARIEKAGGFVKHMPGGARVMGDLNLSRAMGDLRYKQKPELPPAEQIVTVFPDVTIVPFKPEEDEFLVLGCDGIWETNTNQDAVDFVRSRLLVQKGSEEAQSRPLSGICAEICDKGLCPCMETSRDGKGCDNMTVMVVQLKALIEGTPRPERNTALKRPIGSEEQEQLEPPSKRTA